MSITAKQLMKKISDLEKKDKDLYSKFDKEKVATRNEIVKAQELLQKKCKHKLSNGAFALVQAHRGSRMCGCIETSGKCKFCGIFIALFNRTTKVQIGLK